MGTTLTNTIVVMVATSLGFSNFLLPIPAKSEAISQLCEVAIKNGRQRIEQGKRIIVMTRILDERENYPDHPQGRPLLVMISLDGQGADSVMKSPVFQKAIASEIIQSCSSVGAVRFARNQTDWYVTLGLMPNGTIQNFQCVDPDPSRNRLTWGQQVCV